MMDPLPVTYRYTLIAHDDSLHVEIAYLDRDTWTPIDGWDQPRTTRTDLVDTARQHGWILNAPLPDTDTPLTGHVMVHDWPTVIARITQDRNALVDTFTHLDRAWQAAIAAAATSSRGNRHVIATAAGVSGPRVNQIVTTLANNPRAVDPVKSLHQAAARRAERTTP